MHMQPRGEIEHILLPVDKHGAGLLENIPFGLQLLFGSKAQCKTMLHDFIDGAELGSYPRRRSLLEDILEDGVVILRDIRWVDGNTQRTALSQSCGQAKPLSSLLFLTQLHCDVVLVRSRGAHADGRPNARRRHRHRSHQHILSPPNLARERKNEKRKNQHRRGNRSSVLPVCPTKMRTHSPVCRLHSRTDLPL